MSKGSNIKYIFCFHLHTKQLCFKGVILPVLFGILLKYGSKKGGESLASNDLEENWNPKKKPKREYMAINQLSLDSQHTHISKPREAQTQKVHYLS